MSKFNKMFASVVIGLLSITPVSPARAASQCGGASFYGVGDGYHGQRTASGEIFNTWSNTAAHPWLPMGTKVTVVDQNTGRSTRVRINDRGPYAGGRVIDLSAAAMQAISSTSRGVTNVCLYW